MQTDFLCRVSLKCVIRNQQNQILVVKEAGRQSWDLPGGGMDHGESIKTAIARELKEEINLRGDFTHQIIHVDDPAPLATRPVWQLRLIFDVIPQDMTFSAGDDADEIMFVDPTIFKDANAPTERAIYQYYLDALN